MIADPKVRYKRFSDECWPDTCDRVSNMLCTSPDTTTSRAHKLVSVLSMLRERASFGLPVSYIREFNSFVLTESMQLATHILGIGK